MPYMENWSLQEGLAQWDKADCGLDPAVMESFKKRKVIFFLGAGVSRLEGVKGWEDFANLLISKAFPLLIEREQLFNGNLSSKEKITIAYEKFAADGKLDEFYNEFERALTPNDNVKSVGIYNTLAKFNVNFLTTNADLLFENVLGKELCHTELDANKLFNEDHIARNQLFYLHGRFSKTGEGLVFTVPQYVNQYNNPQFCEFLRNVFKHYDHTIFFIGYGLNEYELIDYIASKTGLNAIGETAHIYILEPFFSNQEILFKARRAYFRSLGIKLLPYCKDNGYVELKNILDKLQIVFNSQANVPYDDFQDLKYYLNNHYSAEALVQVDNILHKHMTDGGFVSACDFIMNSKYRNEWGNAIVNDILWFPAYSEYDYLRSNEIVYCRVNLLDCLMLNTQKSDNEPYIQKAKDILDYVVISNEESLAICYPQLIIKYVNFICRLNDRMLNDSHFDFVKTVFKLFGRNISFAGMTNDNKLLQWSGKSIYKFITSVLGGIPDINDVCTEDAEYFINYFERNNKIIFNNRLACVFFNSFYDYIKTYLDGKSFTVLNYVHNFDNLGKAYYLGLAALFEHIVRYFNEIDLVKQNEYINKGLCSNNELICKFWIYILRKTRKDISFVLNDAVTCFSHEMCICELYLLFIDCEKDGYVNKLKQILDNATFGINIKYRSEYLQQIKNTFFSAIGVNINGICYDIIGEAARNDYTYTKFVEANPYNEMPIDKIIEKFQHVPEESKVELSAIAQSLVKKLIKIPSCEISTRLKVISGFSHIKVNLVILYLRQSIDSLPEEIKPILCDFTLQLLITESNYALLYKNCFAFLARLDLSTLYKDNKFKLCWNKWNNKVVGDFIVKEYSGEFIGNLINTGEYEKINFFINYWTARFHSEHMLLSDNELRQIISASDVKITKWCMSYYFWYIGCLVGDNDKISRLLHGFVANNEDEHDYISLFLIISSMRYLNREVTDLIRSTGFLSNKDFFDKSDKNMILRIYSYVIAAFFTYDLSIDFITPLLDKQKFYDQIFLYMYKKIINSNLSVVKKFKDTIWPKLNETLQNNGVLRSYVLLSMRSLFLNDIIIKDIVEIAINMLSLCDDGNEDLVADADFLIEVYKKYKSEGEKFIELTFLKSKYQILTDESLEKIVVFLVGIDAGFAKDLIKNLYSHGQLPIELYNKLYVLIEPSC